MTKHLTVAERLASTAKDELLDDITSHSQWDRYLVEQAVLHFGETLTEWSCNDLRDVLPELGAGYLGAAINSLRSGGVIAHTGRTVFSTQERTHGHRIAVWCLTADGHRIAEQRRKARAAQQRRAAA